MTLDRTARDRLAELLRHLASGRISTDRFSIESDQLVYSTQDPGVQVVYGAGIALAGQWDAIGSICFRGRFRLAPDDRRRMARAVVFLHSDAAYEWPSIPLPRETVP